jgi:tellurite resistance protein TehA-like permease
MSTTYDGKRVLLGTGIALAAFLAGVTGALWWFMTTFTFWGSADDQAHQSAALGLVVCAIATAVLGSAVGFHFRAPIWSLVVVGLTVVALTAGTVHELVAATTAPAADYVDYTAWDLWLLPACPTSWPLLVFAVVALVRTLRARWYPVQQPRPAR